MEYLVNRAYVLLQLTLNLMMMIDTYLTGMPWSSVKHQIPITGLMQLHHKKIFLEWTHLTQLTTISYVACVVVDYRWQTFMGETGKTVTGSKLNSLVNCLPPTGNPVKRKSGLNNFNFKEL